MRRTRLVALPLALLLGAPLALVAAQPAAAARPTIDRELVVETLNQQVEWTVPDGVTQVRVELAAGAGAGSTGFSVSAAGGPGGHLVADVPVTSGEVLIALLGASGSTSGERAGGASVLARADGELLAVAGGGGASYACTLAGMSTCGSGGAGGFSATSGTSSGLSGSGSRAGTGATSSAPGTSEDFTSTFTFATTTSTTEPGAAPSADSVAVVSGSIVVPPTTQPPFGRDAAGASGYFSGGHGGGFYFFNGFVPSFANDGGGGGGGSGYLDESVTLVELRDSLGDGSLTLRWSEPAPPAITLSAGEVEQGDELTVSGTGFGSGEELRVVLNSDPIDLGGVIADADGAFSQTVTVPADAPVGDHVITVGSTSAPLRVLAAAAAPVDPVDPVDPGEPTDPAPSSPAPPASQPRLAESGAHPALPPMSAAALALLLAGALLMLRARRSPTRPPVN